MRIIFIGSVEFSKSALERLIDIGAEVVGICTLQKSPSNADHVDLAPVGETHGIPVKYTEDINSSETVAWIAKKNPDVIFCFGWSRLLKEELLRAARLGVVGFHPAALPSNRGRHPIIWALALGLEKTASTFFFMDTAADSGDILSQEEVHISASDDAASLYAKITSTALAQIEAFVPQLAAGTHTREKQDDRLATSWRKRGRRDGVIDWRMSARTINNLVRALTKPYVGAHFVVNEQEIKLWQVELVDNLPENAEPGKVLSDDDRGPVVKCGEGGIRLLVTEPQVELLADQYL